MLKAEIKKEKDHYKIYILDNDKISDISFVDEVKLTDDRGVKDDIDLEDLWK